MQRSIASAHNELTELLARNQGRFLSFLKKRVSDTNAQDILQNAFINAVQNLHKFRGRAKLSTWFNTILRNLVYAHYNHKRRFTRLQREIVNRNFYEPFKQCFPDGLKCLLEKAIYSLPNAKHRQIIKLRYYEHLKLSQIHKILGADYKAVEIQHRRALQCLKQLILKDPYFKGLLEYVKTEGFKKC